MVSIMSERRDNSQTCAGCGSKFQRDVNFKHHARTCNFKRGVKRKLDQQSGSGAAAAGGADEDVRVAMGDLAAPLLDDPIARSIEMRGIALAPYMRKIGKSKPKSPFYLSLLLRYEGMRNTPVLIFTKPGMSMREHGDELVRQLEDRENQGMKIEKYLRLRVHVPIVETGQALNGTLRDFSIPLERREQTVENIFEVLRDAVYSYRNTIVKIPSSKVSLSLHLLFHLSVDPSYLTDPPVVITTSPVEKLEGGMEVNDILENFYTKLLDLIEQYELCGSGWVLNKLLRLDLHVLRFDPLRASTHIPLPKEIKLKHAVLNIRNSDNLCFLWCVIAELYPCDIHKDRVSNYRKYQGNFNIEGINMPMALKDIPKFERRNNVSISVYGYKQGKEDSQEEEGEEGEEEKGYVYPLKIVKDVMERHVNLLLFSDGRSSHYCLIRHFSRLVRSQVIII
jgi:hypothetical protein